MKKVSILFLLILFFSCKKELTPLNGTNQEEFDKSIELMERELNSSQQPKLREAVQLIYTYESHMETEDLKWSRTRQLLNGKDAEEIIAMAEKTAAKNGINWDINTLGTLDSLKPKSETSEEEETQTETQKDYSQIETATELEVNTTEIDNNNDGVNDGIMIFPALKNHEHTDVEFSNLDLEAIVKLNQNETLKYTKNQLFTHSNMGKVALKRGIYVPFSALTPSKFSGEAVDVEVQVKTPERYFKAYKGNIQLGLNKYLAQKEEAEKVEEESQQATEEEKTQITQIVSQFLERINAKEYKKAQDLSVNPAWKEMDKFTSKDLGFGAIKSVVIDNIKLKNYDGVKEKATVLATYTMQHETAGEMTFTKDYFLQKIGDNWRIIDTKKLN